MASVFPPIGFRALGPTSPCDLFKTCMLSDKQMHRRAALDIAHALYQTTHQMASENFGQHLRRVRQSRDLSQAKLAADLLVTQATISGWEVGKQLPALDDAERIRKLAEFLDQQPTLLEARLRDELRERDSTRIPTEEEYLDEQQAYLTDVGRNNVDVWLLGAETLPLLHSPFVRNIWIDNLNNGSNYNVIWFLDLVPDSALVRLAPVLRGVGQQVELEKGRIIHHALGVLDTPKLESSSAEEYRTLREEAEYTPANLFNEIIDGQRIPKDVRLSLLRYYNAYGSVIIYVPRQRSIKCLASVSLSGIKTRRNGESLVGYFFLDEEHSTHLGTVIHAFKRALRG